MRWSTIVQGSEGFTPILSRASRTVVFWCVFLAVSAKAALRERGEPIFPHGCSTNRAPGRAGFIAISKS